MCSNSRALLQIVPETQQEKLSEIGDPDINLLMKTLGIAWNPNSDTFTFCLPKPQTNDAIQLTKRLLLSEIARIFDPLGFFGPVLGIQIPRWIFSDGRIGVELHGFADASDLAYGVCIYARSNLDDSKAEKKLICSKSRILPKKQNGKKEVTTPRAELQAALLLARIT